MRRGVDRWELAARGRGYARGVVTMVACAATMALAAGCGGMSSGHANLVNGKDQFLQKCGACHTLARAGTTGTAGPNLDAAFERARIDGLGETTFAGVVQGQIEQPSRLAQVDPATGKPAGMMPANLVTGDDAGDVAAYVAMTAGAGGKDSGQLAAVGGKPKGTAKAEGGTLDIPVSAGLAYAFAAAEAPAGALTLNSKNDTPIDHNIAIEGNGLDEKGPVIKNGAVSTVEADLQPGEYVFYCSVPGHREGGMEGKLTVK